MIGMGDYNVGKPFQKMMLKEMFRTRKPMDTLNTSRNFKKIQRPWINI